MDSNTTDIEYYDIKMRPALYSFLGNSLLKVMTADTALGLDPEFWENFIESFGLDVSGEEEEIIFSVPGNIKSAVTELQRIVTELQELGEASALERSGVEYTQLFVGPGRPAAPPWETLYREGGTVLFGQPTFDIKQLFAERGYRLSTDCHQLEDHIGVELLYLALVFSEVAQDLTDLEREEIRDFIRRHPLAFISELYGSASAFCAEHSNLPGYYPAILKLIWVLLLRESVA